MIGTIRKHSTWVWGLIIVVTIVTFVFWGSQSYNRGGGGGHGNYGSILGHPIAQDQFLDAYHEVELHFFYNYGSWPDRDTKQLGFDVERETYFRLLFIQKEKDLGITISDEAAAELGNHMLSQLNHGRPVPLDDFVTQVLQPHGLTEADFMRFLRHNLVIQQLLGTVGAVGKLVTPAEIQSLYVRENQESSVQPVFFSASNYLARVTVTPEAFGRFYTNQMARYHLPDRMQVTYVAFPASNYMAEAQHDLAQITNLNERIEATYQKYGTNFPNVKTPEEAKARIRQLLLEQDALQVARRKANDFANALYDKQPVKIGNLAQLAGERGRPAQVSKPFSREEPPDDLKVAEPFAKAAFALTADDPIAGPVAGQDTIYEIELNKRIPAENPPLDSIRDQVMADCRMNEAVQQAHNAGAAFYMQATNGLARGKTFPEICRQAGVTPGKPVDIALTTRELPEVEEQVNLGVFKQAVFGTEIGSISSFVPSEDGGFLVFVKGKLPLDRAKMQADLPAYTAKLRSTRESEALNRWFGHEAEVALRDTPVARPQKAPASGAPPD